MFIGYVYPMIKSYLKIFISYPMRYDILAYIYTYTLSYSRLSIKHNLNLFILLKTMIKVFGK